MFRSSYLKHWEPKCADKRDVVALKFFRLKTFRLTFLHMRNKCKIINESDTIKDFRYKCHGLFVNSPVMISVKSFLKCRSIQ